MKETIIGTTVIGLLCLFYGVLATTSVVEYKNCKPGEYYGNEYSTKHPPNYEDKNCNGYI